MNFVRYFPNCLEYEIVWVVKKEKLGDERKNEK